ncbi:MAG: DNA mismatch repair endonuclease MutL, partial [Endomicrobia bacterium]|nr:DNA mismatch repair endonuclease MutL [Endomicrobiia bacterium]
VIERPLNVVKELIENSIDAQATEILINLEDYGKSLIEVKDNGFGMNLSDISQAIKRHATSKIQNFEDIYNLNTLGFRGEAIPSIASISKMEIISKKESSLTGIKTIIINGKIEQYEEIATENGTSIKVKDLFYNTPVRKKFLKS